MPSPGVELHQSTDVGPAPSPGSKNGQRSIPPRSINCYKGFGSKPLAILDGVDSEGLRVLFGEAHAVVADAETLLAALVLQGLDAARAGIPPADEWR